MKRMKRKRSTEITPDDVKGSIGGVSYPATKGMLLRQAERAHADEQVLDVLWKLPDIMYSDPLEAEDAIDELFAEMRESEEARLMQ